MLIFVVESEPARLRASCDAVASAAPDAEVMAFESSAEAIEEICDRGRTPDALFVGLEEPETEGLAFAALLLRLCPPTRIICLADSGESAVEAYRLHLHGFILWPLTPERVREELEVLPRRNAEMLEDGKLQVRCFGHFEVFWQGRPLVFSRTKTKELLAFLIDREGAYCTAGEIISALWEDSEESESTKHYLRVLTGDLTATLDRIGMRGALLRRRGQWAVDREMLSCDYYRMQEGDAAALRMFRGEYMAEYSWAEMTTGRIFFQNLDAMGL